MQAYTGVGAAIIELYASFCDIELSAKVFCALTGAKVCIIVLN